MSGEPLNNSLVDFSHILDAKRREYWKQAREGVPLESIRYQNVNILVDAEEEDDMLWNDEIGSDVDEDLNSSDDDN